MALVGACPDAPCLVYEYLHNGSLHGRLFSECNTPLLPWKIRARIVAEISSALLFLRSCKPQMIVHGGLNLENILLDSNLHCKLADFGILTEDTKGYPAFTAAGSGLKGTFPYAAREYERSEVPCRYSSLICTPLVL